MIMGVGGALVAETERRIVTSKRLFMQPYPTDKDLVKIAVELVSAGNTEGADGQAVWLSLIDVRNEVICAP
jgi:hypothetical protein